MRVEAVEVIRVSLPMLAPFRAAHGMVTERQSLLVRVESDRGMGWGECPALMAPTYTHEYIDGAELVLVGHLLPAVVGRDVEASGLRDLLSHVVGHPLAKAGIEMAMLDAELRADGRSLAARLGATRTSVECGVAVGIADTPAQLVTSVGDLLEQGYRRVKLKISPGWDVEPVRAVRHAFGDDLALQVDANGSYRPSEVTALKALDDFGLALIEQPFPPDALLAHAGAKRLLRTPIALDESITSVQALADVIALKACDVISVKPGLVGGLLEAAAIHDVAQEAGLAMFCGGMLETGIGRAANLALAALPGFGLPGDLSPSRRWFADDLTEGMVMHEGRILVPTGPGIGVEPDEATLDRFVVGRQRVR